MNRPTHLPVGLLAGLHISVLVVVMLPMPAFQYYRFSRET